MDKKRNLQIKELLVSSEQWTNNPNAQTTTSQNECGITRIVRSRKPTFKTKLWRLGTNMKYRVKNGLCWSWGLYENKKAFSLLKWNTIELAANQLHAQGACFVAYYRDDA